MLPSDDGALPYRLTQKLRRDGDLSPLVKSMMRETFVSRAIRVGVVSNGCCTRLRYRDPQRAIASCDEWQAVFIAWPVGVVRQLEFLSTASQHLPSCACFLISAEASCINVRIFWASIAAAVTRCSLRSMCLARGAPPSSRSARTRR